MKVLALADIHGNLPALRAVLAQLDGEPVDAIVVCGDTAAGPLVQPALELLAARAEPVHWVRGNGERETVDRFDGVVPANATSEWAIWTAGTIERRWRDAMAGWPPSLELDGVCYCHGTPRSDEEILTRATPVGVIAAALAGSPGRLVVGGHTHQQFVRELPDGRRLANAGSVGVPYEGRAGAFWMLVEDGVPRAREIAYDVPRAVTELHESGFPDLDGMLDAALLLPVDPDWTAAFFEHQAGRGADPGEPTHAGDAPD